MPEKRPIKLTLIAATATHCGTNWIGKCQHLRAREMDARCDVFGHEWEYSDGDAMPGRLPACIAAEKEVNQERDRAIERAEKAEREWRPIETAPKDGTWISVCWGSYQTDSETGGYRLPVAVQWRSFHPNAPGKQCWRNYHGQKIDAVTHWQPLPAAPKEPM